MIKGVHTMFYATQADELRAFVRDKLQLPYHDVGGGWLIFDFNDAELGCHPTTGGNGDEPNGSHVISFYCDDIAQTVAELKGRGVEFSGDITDRDYGLTTHILMPSGLEVELYQPNYRAM